MHTNIRAPFLSLRFFRIHRRRNHCKLTKEEHSSTTLSLTQSLFSWIQGQGLRRWPSGQTYSGAFKWGEMHGQGSMVKSNGDRYEGSFDSNCWHGIGEFTSADGTVYEGEFSQNKFHGQGSITYIEGRNN